MAPFNQHKRCIFGHLIRSNQRKRNISTQEHFLPTFERYATRHGINWDTSSLICNPCYGKIRLSNLLPIVNVTPAPFLLPIPSNSNDLQSVPDLSVPDENVSSEESMHIDNFEEIDVEGSLQSVPFNDSEPSLHLNSASISTILSDSSDSELSSVGQLSVLSSSSASLVDSQASDLSIVSFNSVISIVRVNSIQAIAATQRHCCLCRNPNGRKVFPKTALKQAWEKLNVFIPGGNRLCGDHLVGGLLTSEALSLVHATQTGIEISSNQFAQWLLDITAPSSEKSFRLDFGSSPSTSSLDEKHYEMFTSLSKAKFEDLFIKHVDGHIRSSANRSPRDVLAMLLMVLRKNLTQDIVAFLFQTSQTVVSRSIEAALSALEVSFVPNHLGVYHLTREDALQKHSIQLFNEVLELPSTSLGAAGDCTYAFIEKPGDAVLQKKTWSAHKRRNLVKVMLIVLPSGYILDASGPYFTDGANNDANIMKYLLSESDLPLFFDEGDFILYDRGFRDVVDETASNGMHVYMPKCLPNGRNQFTCEEGNESRKVTMCRWIVESTNGRLKNVFKFFAAVIEAGYTPFKIMRMCKVACAILNNYHPPLFQDTPRHREVAAGVLNRCTVSNLLQEEIQEKNLQSRPIANWEKISGDALPDFPVLTWKDLENLTLGCYQLRIAEKYNIKKLEDDPEYAVFVHRIEPGITRSKFNSRFTGQTIHDVWVKTDEEKAGLDAILGWFCSCKVGARVVGCCSHVTALIRYLSFDRYQTEKTNTRAKPDRGAIDVRDFITRMAAEVDASE